MTKYIYSSSTENKNKNKYNYSMLFFLHPKGTSKGRPNARHFRRAVVGLSKLNFINNSSPGDKLHTTCTKTNI